MTSKLGEDTNNALSQHTNNQHPRPDIYHQIMIMRYIFLRYLVLVDSISRSQRTTRLNSTQHLHLNVSSNVMKIIISYLISVKVVDQTRANVFEFDIK